MKAAVQFHPSAILSDYRPIIGASRAARGEGVGRGIKVKGNFYSALMFFSHTCVYTHIYLYKYTGSLESKSLFFVHSYICCFSLWGITKIYAKAFHLRFRSLRSTLFSIHIYLGYSGCSPRNFRLCSHLFYHMRTPRFRPRKLSPI
jgi:hypothetical protein